MKNIWPVVLMIALVTIVFFALITEIGRALAWIRWGFGG